MRLSVLAILTALIPTFATAQDGCFGTGQPLFHCTMKGGAKALDICRQGNVGLYRFGPGAGRAELLLGRHVRNIRLSPWGGMGSLIYEEVEFSAGDVTYQVYYAVSRSAADTPDMNAGVRVLRGDQMLADLTCDAGSVSVHDFSPLFEAKTAAGQCWQNDSSTWVACQAPDAD